MVSLALATFIVIFLFASAFDVVSAKQFWSLEFYYSTGCYNEIDFATGTAMNDSCIYDSQWSEPVRYSCANGTIMKYSYNYDDTFCQQKAHYSERLYGYPDVWNICRYSSSSNKYSLLTCTDSVFPIDGEDVLTVVSYDSSCSTVSSLFAAPTDYCRENSKFGSYLSYPYQYNTGDPSCSLDQGYSTTDLSSCGADNSYRKMFRSSDPVFLNPGDTLPPSASPTLSPTALSGSDIVTIHGSFIMGNIDMAYFTDQLYSDFSAILYPALVELYELQVVRSNPWNYTISVSFYPTTLSTSALRGSSSIDLANVPLSKSGILVDFTWTSPRSVFQGVFFSSAYKTSTGDEIAWDVNFRLGYYFIPETWLALCSYSSNIPYLLCDMLRNSTYVSSSATCDSSLSSYSCSTSSSSSSSSSMSSSTLIIMIVVCTTVPLCIICCAVYCYFLRRVTSAQLPDDLFGNQVQMTTASAPSAPPDQLSAATASASSSAPSGVYPDAIPLQANPNDAFLISSKYLKPLPGYTSLSSVDNNNNFTTAVMATPVPSSGPSNGLAPTQYFNLRENGYSMVQSNNNARNI